MSDTQPQAGDGPVHEDVLIPLEETLERLGDKARQEDYDAVDQLIAQSRHLLDRAGRITPPLSEAAQRRLERIEKLYQKAHLALADAKEEFARKLASSSHARRALHAYGGRDGKEARGSIRSSG